MIILTRSRQEACVLHTSDLQLTRELHILQAHLLYYKSLLENFRLSVIFVQDTPNPAMDAADVSEQEREQSAEMLRIEAGHLLGEIERLEGQRMLQIKRLVNVIDLVSHHSHQTQCQSDFSKVFASVNIDDSRHTRRLTEAALRDSAAIKQVCHHASYLHTD